MNGEVTEFVICESCARKRGMLAPFMESLSQSIPPAELQAKMEEIIHQIKQEAQIDLPTMSPSHKHAVGVLECPRCHFKLDDYQQTGRLGCAECYDAFASYLYPERAADSTKQAHSILTAAHKSTEGMSLAQRLKQLETELERAVSQEAYEQAATLRDEITRIKGHSKG